MAARTDKNIVLLTLIINEIIKRGDAEKLPPVMTLEAITTQIHEHEAALEGRQSASNGAGEERGKAAEVFAGTAAFLTRVRYLLLAVFGSGSSKLDAFGPLGALPSPLDNHVRLVAVIPKLQAATDAGELVVPAELQPTALDAHATLHAEVSKSKAGKVASSQVGGKTLRAERKETKEMIKRLRGFVRAFYGDEEMSAFGFTLPLPPRRPRIVGEQTEPAETSETATQPSATEETERAA